ncbi:MAG: HDIG domain-containing protein [Planctomycetes bacterium]|nr:HDIG domain-containing protein [Planctomycetota bacterium]
MAKDVIEHRLALIEERLGESESAQRRIDWSSWSGRISAGAGFSVVMLAVLLAPYDGMDALTATGHSLMVFGFVFLYGLYLWRFRPDLFNERGKQILFGACVLFSAAGAKIAMSYPQWGDFRYEFVVPLMLFSIIYAVVFDQRFALDATLFTIMGIAAASFRSRNFEALPLIVMLAGSVVAVLLTRNLRSRYKLALVGLAGGLGQALLILALYLIGSWQHADRWIGVGAWMGISVARGALIGVVATFMLPLIERVFRITTDLRLIELLEREHPLLTMMQERAPGTYQHTLNVAKFTKKAVEAIGGNALLAEVAIMFHDLGKMVRPEYFTENEPDSKLLHDRLSPMMSAMIIISHVTDGILLARKHKLPPIFEDFIAGHHGTSVVKYFYYKAKAGAKEGETILESQFRYPGPKPQTKESAVSAVADHVEATARSRFSAGIEHPDDLRNMVREAINTKLLDGQFDECHITKAELAKVEDSLVSSLAALYHHRVKYLEDPDKKRRAEAVEAREKYRREQAQRKEKILTQ